MELLQSADFGMVFIDNENNREKSRKKRNSLERII